MPDCPLSPHSVCSLPQCFSASTDVVWMTTESALSVTHQTLPTCPAHPHYQPSLPDRPCICARRRGWPWHEICGWASIQVQGPFLLLSLNSCCLLHPTLWNMSCMSFNSLLRNRLFSSSCFCFLFFTIPLRIPVATFSFSSEISILNDQPMESREGQECLLCLGPLQAGGSEQKGRK